MAFLYLSKTDDPSMFYFRVLIVVVLFIVFFGGALCIISRNKTVKKIKSLSKNAVEVSPQEFFDLRNKRSKGKNSSYLSKKHDFSGVYILYNETKNMYYVGQGVRVFQRVNSHFTGHGNGDVYADYKYGDSFKIRMIPLKGSGFETLNALERNTIITYNSFSEGYNKTRGNRG